MPEPLRFARFEVLTRSDGSPQVLGEAGTALAWKARDTGSGATVMLRVPGLGGQVGPTTRLQFIQEARAMQRVDNPHVARVLEAEDTPAGAFCAMEFCDGATLQEWIESGGPLDWTQVFRLALQIASALQALEAQGLVLHGLKPAKILVLPDAAGGAHLKLMDYGLPAAGPVIGDTIGATLSISIETPPYASPEEFLGSPAHDFRSQIYSLGTVLWFCLTGKPPFDGTRFEVMFHHVNTEPDWSRLPAMPEAALAVLKRLLAKSADERYASPEALCGELHRLVGVTASVPPPLKEPSIPPSSGADGYELLAEAGSDAFGKVWKARDLVTDRTVALRQLSREFVAKQDLVTRVQRLAAYVRLLEHPHWQAVLHAGQSGVHFRFVTEWVDGPSVLALMKARQTLPLREAAPLLVQVAAAMDFAAAHCITAVETAPERLVIQVEGWSGMTESDHSALLRRPLDSWAGWSVRVCPLRLDMSAGGCVLPTDTGAGDAVACLGADFVRLCYRLLTGHGRGGGAYVPAPTLSAEGNTFFERHLVDEKRTAVPCRELLQRICRAEGVPVPGGLADDTGDPLATRVVPAKRAASATVPAMQQDVMSTVMLRSLETRIVAPAHDSGPQKSTDALKAERERLAHERDALERARRDVAAQEAGRARRLSEEQVRIEEQRRALEQQQRVLEEKRREQQRLEQEIQLRAQLEFQKHQEEARAMESQVRHKHEAAEEALRQREKEFREREKQSIERLEALRRENKVMAEMVQAETITLRRCEWTRERRKQDEEAVTGLVMDKLAADERRLKELRVDVRSHEAELQHARRKRTVFLAMGVLGVVVFVLFGAYVVRGLMQEARLPGHALWDAAQSERDSLRKQKAWAGLLHWCVATDALLISKPEFAALLDRHRHQLAADASEAVAGLLEAPQLPDAASESGHALLLDVEKVRSWRLPPEHLLLLAKLRMPEAATRGAAPEFFQAYLNAIRVHRDFAAELAADFKDGLGVLRRHMASGKATADETLRPLLQQVTALAPADEASQAVQFLGELLADQAQRSGRPEDGLRALLESTQRNPGATDSFRPRAEAIVDQLAALPPERIQSVTAELRSAAETWKLPAAMLVLAGAEKDENARFELYRQADKLGGPKAAARLGQALLDMGAGQKNAGLIQQGVAKLREASAAGDAGAMMSLGEAFLSGRGVTADAAEALKLARQAQARDHPEGFYLAARSLLRLAEQNRDAGQYAQATALLDRAVEQKLPGAAWLLYQSTYNQTVRNADRAFAALEKGAAGQDANCMHILGLWIISGSPPARQDLNRGRTLIEKAAALGHERARDWLRVRP